MKENTSKTPMPRLQSAIRYLSMFICFFILKSATTWGQAPSWKWGPKNPDGSYDIYFTGSGGYKIRNMGFGTSSPIAPITFPSILGNKISLWNYGKTHFGLGIGPALFQIFTDRIGSDFAFGYGSSDNFTETVRIRGNGNIGIGMKDPGFPLNFASTAGDKISFWGNSGVSYGIGVQSLLLQIHTDIHTSDIAFGYGSSKHFNENLRIKGNGNVGIGTSSPTERLTIAGGSTPGLLFTSGPGFTYGIIKFGTIDHYIKSGVVGGMELYDNSSIRLMASKTLSFSTDNFRDTSQSKELMTILNNGNIGIGTTKPGAPLSFASYVGAKILLYGDSALNFGLGIQNYLLQIYTSGKNSDIAFGYGSSAAFTETMRIKGNGNVGIGTKDPGDYKLAVEGKIGAREVEVKSGPWPDFVFDKKYTLRTLQEVEDFISTNKHLPEIPSEETVKKEGINLGNMNALLLQKIEELTLYVIDQDKRIKAVEKENAILREKVNQH
ncbi:hypothetical protein [Chitinophaga flava]|nr:hypothetical protein [Chitinophaga flava]